MITPNQAATETNMSRQARLPRLLGFLASDPSNMLLRADVFEAALHIGNFEIAEEQVNAARKSTFTPDWRMREADLAIAREQLDSAQTLLLAMQHEFGPHSALAHNLGFIAALRKQYEACLTTISPWTDVPPNDTVLPGLQALWLRTLHHLGQIDQAVDWARQRSAANTLHPTALGVASLLALDADQIALAKTWSDRALANTEFAPALEAQITRATLILAERNSKDALAATDDILQRHPQEGRTWSVKGFAHLLALDLDNARRSLERATGLIPSHIGTWHGLAWSCLLIKDYVAAQRAFDEALQRNRNFAESHGGLAVLAIVQGHLDAAQEHLRRASGLDSESVTARYAQALLNGDIKDPRAIREFARNLIANIKPARQ